MIYDLKEYYKEYYKENIKNQYYVCECGIFYMKYHKKSHQKSKKHNKIMKEKINNL
jgi:hypothetical protein